MTTARKRRQIGRVLVALDASPSSLAAARAAVRLAALLEVELCGLFVEDRELLHLSRSPMARQIDLLTASIERVESAEVERQFRVQALRARQALARIAEEAGLAWSFRVARGSVAQEVRAAAGESDVVSLGRVGWSLRHRRLLGRTARALLAERRRFTMLIERLGEARPLVAVVHDGSEAAADALDLAERLTRGGVDRLVVILVGREPARLRPGLAERLPAAPERTIEVALDGGADARLCRILRGMGAGLLIVPLSETLGETQIQSLLDEVDCPVLAVS